MDVRQLTKTEIPAPLREIPQPPDALYLRGTLPEGAYLTVVGARKSSAYGRDACERIIEGLAGSPFVIVSGLALGIDSIAHRAALSAGLPTVAIPGSGVSDEALYPRSHLRLAQEIIETGGGVFSEYEPDTRAQSYMFPRRNRLMAGIASGVLVVEARERSGTLITARLALEYNREVCAVPGPITSDASRGPNALIRDGATPITSADDLRELFGMERTDAGRDAHLAAAASLTDEERRVYEALGEPATHDDIARTTGFPPDKVGVIVTMLALKGAVHDEGNTVRRA